MKNYFYKVYILLFLLTVGYGINAQKIVQLSFYAPLISTTDMKYIDNHLVVSQNGFLIFDVTNPEQKPQLLAQIPYPGTYGYNINAQGNSAYMAHGNNGIFAVYNISNFENPVLTGSLAIPSTAYYSDGDIEPYGKYVYVSGFDSIYVVNVSNSSSPVLANAFAVPHTDFSGAENMAITNNTLFVKTPFAVQGYDIHDAVNPVLITSIPNPPSHPYIGELAVDTINYRLFIPWLSTLQEFEGHNTYNVSNASSPQFMFADSIAFGGGDFGISAYSDEDTVLYLSKGGGINTFNVATATHDFVTSFSGEDVANATVAIDVKDSVFFNAKGGGLENLKYTNTLPPPICQTPAGLRSAISGTTVCFTWNKVKGADGYIVRYRQANHGWNFVPSKDNTKTITNLLPNTLYYWEVATVCDLSNRDRSEFTLTERFTTGSGLTAETSIAITPNPVHDVFRITIKDPSVKEIVITNLTGNTVMQLPNVTNGQSISFSKMHTGTYMVSALNSNKQVVGKATLLKE